jgi:hypothetical protein
MCKGDSKWEREERRRRRQLLKAERQQRNEALAARRAERERKRALVQAFCQREFSKTLEQLRLEQRPWLAAKGR